VYAQMPVRFIPILRCPAGGRRRTADRARLPPVRDRQRHGPPRGRRCARPI